MKKIYISLVLIVLAVNICRAQVTWGTSGSNIYYNSGNVGIGTTAPTGLLHLASPSNIDLKLISGAVGGYSRLFFGAGSNGIRWNVGQRDDIGGIFNIEGDANGSGAWGSRLAVTLAGNVGIGTANPSSALQIGDFNNTSVNNQLLIPGVYNFEQIRLGQISNGNSSLEFVNHNNLTNSYGVRLLVDVDHGAPGLQFQYAPSTSSYASLSYVTGLYMNLSGNIGIGTTNPGTYRLAVNGGIHSQNVNVDMTGWSDYVFKKEYQLPSLSDVKTYIDQNHHLPDMPSEQEVIKAGINLGEMNKLLMKKVEELTLYMIEKDKIEKEQKELNKEQQIEIDIQKSNSRTQEERIKKLEKQVEALTQRIGTKEHGVLAN